MGKSYIERLIEGAVEKNINAKANIGKYNIDLEYTRHGVEYTISKNNSKIFTILREDKYKTIKITTTPFFKGIDLVNLTYYINNRFKGFLVVTK